MEVRGERRCLVESVRGEPGKCKVTKQSAKEWPGWRGEGREGPVQRQEWDPWAPGQSWCVEAIMYRKNDVKKRGQSQTPERRDVVRDGEG